MKTSMSAKELLDPQVMNKVSEISKKSQGNYNFQEKAGHRRDLPDNVTEDEKE